MALIASHKNGVSDPALELRHILAFVSGESVRDVDELGCEVLEDLNVARIRGEGKDLAGVGDQGEGLLIEGVEGVIGLRVGGGDAWGDGLQF